MKIRRSGAAEDTSAPPVQAIVRQERPLQAAPLEPPYDRQCIMRFPEDVSDKISDILKNSGTTDTTEVIRISLLEDERVKGVEFRLFRINVFEDQNHLTQFDMRGVLVDLPTFVESYKTVNNGTTVTKSSDVSQMMVCFKLCDFDMQNPSVELQKALDLLYPSGITPPTSGIRHRKFRPAPSKEEVQNMRSAEDLVENVMSGGALEWVVETEVDEEEAVSRSINEPDNVWTPTEEILNQLRRAGFIDANGDIITGAEDQEMEEDDEESDHFR